MAELLLELLSEEIPARMQAQAAEDLRKHLEEAATHRQIMRMATMIAIGAIGTAQYGRNACGYAFLPDAEMTRADHLFGFDEFGDGLFRKANSKDHPEHLAQERSIKAGEIQRAVELRGVR